MTLQALLTQVVKFLKMHQISKFFKSKINVVLALVLMLILGGIGLGVNRFLKVDPSTLPTEIVDLNFNPEGPYAILEPRRDGNAINLNIFRVAAYESINYELAYQSAGSTADEGIGNIDRGVQGTIESKDEQGSSAHKKSEYRQEILFGTCSKADTFATASCVFDKNVEDGTLILNIKKPYENGDKVNTVYKMVTSWHLQQPDVALGVITSTDNHFQYKVDLPSDTKGKTSLPSRGADDKTKVTEDDLSIVGFTMVNDLTGAPKLPSGKSVLGKVYAMNLPTAKTFPPGDLTIELIDNAPRGTQIGRYNEAQNSWDLLETKVEGSKVMAAAPGAGIFAVFVNSN